MNFVLQCPMFELPLHDFVKVLFSKINSEYGNGIR